MEQAARGKLRSLELGRFIAASFVVITHLMQFVDARAIDPAHLLLGGVDGPGALGVQYFFVLSGFVMMTAHHGDFGNLKAVPVFWWRRACRIYPMYWLALSVPAYFLLGMMTPYLTLQLVSLEPATVADFIAPAWTLRYEIAFYLVFGLCLLPYVGKPILASWIVIVLSLWSPYAPLTRFMIALPGHDAGLFIARSHFLSFFELYFFFGLAAGWLYVKFGPARRKRIAVFVLGLLLLLASLPAINYGRGYGSPNTVFVESIVIGVFLLGLAWLEGGAVFRLGRWASLLGAVSYPVYLIHTPVVLVADKLIPKKLGTAGLYEYFAVTVVVTYGISWLATVLFDQPLQRLLRRIKV